MSEDKKQKKRLMHSFTIKEISAVDRPCQEGAIAVMTKNFVDPKTPTSDDFIKMSFRQALDESTMNQKFSDAFYTAFENSWNLNDAFKEGLKDAFQDGEETLRQYIEEVTIMARAALERTKTLTKDGNIDSIAIKEAIEKASAELIKTCKELKMTEITNKNELEKAIAKFEKDGGTNADINAITLAATNLGLEKCLPAAGALAKSDSNAEIEKLQARLDKRDAIDALDSDELEHYNALSKMEQDEFLGKPKKDKKKDIAAKNADDPVLHKCVDGTVIRKSDGPTVLALAKGRDEDKVKIAELEKSSTETIIEKNAAEKYPNVATNVAVSMLKSANAVGIDTPEGKSVVSTLENLNKGNGSLFDANGSDQKSDLNKTTADAVSDFNSKVIEIEKRDGISKVEAMSKARGENAELFAEAYPQTAEIEKREL